MGRSSRRYDLTPREEQVLGLLLAGHSNKSVGQVLGISPRTVEVHRSRVMLKMGAVNAMDLANRARQWVPTKVPTSDIAFTTPLEAG